MFKDVYGIECLTGMLVMKEIFINKSFINQGYVIIGLSGDMKKRKEVYWEDLQRYLITDIEYSLDEFTKKYKSEIELIYTYKDRKKLILSWLEICQIATLLKMEKEQNEESIQQIITELNDFQEFSHKML